MEALNAVGKLYSLAYPEMCVQFSLCSRSTLVLKCVCSENNDHAAIKHFGWIPDEILKITSTSSEVRYALHNHFPEINDISLI